MQRGYGQYGGLGDFGAGYLPTGQLSSPGLYNMSLWGSGWLPSWANLDGGILGPLYTPAIRDPAAVAAIKAGSWDFSTKGSMFDPQGNYDLIPGLPNGGIPNHFYSGRSMTMHGVGDLGGHWMLPNAQTGVMGQGMYSGPLDMVKDAVGSGFQKWKSWVGGMSTVGKVVYWIAVLGVIVAVLGKTKLGKMFMLHKVPVLGKFSGRLSGLKVRRNPKRKKGSAYKPGRQAKRHKPWSGVYGTGYQARYSSKSYRKRHNR